MQCRVHVCLFFRGGGVGEVVVDGGGGVGAAFKIFCMDTIMLVSFLSFFNLFPSFYVCLFVFVFLLFSFSVFFSVFCCCFVYASRCFDIIMILPLHLFSSFFSPFLGGLFDSFFCVHMNGSYSNNVSCLFAILFGVQIFRQLLFAISFQLSGFCRFFLFLFFSAQVLRRVKPCPTSMSFIVSSPLS